MAEQPPHLRAVPPGEAPKVSAELPSVEPAAWAQAAAPSRPRRGAPRWIPVVLALCLVVALALLVWSRTQLTERIAQLQDQVSALQAEVAERDAVIDAHRSRIDDVRRRIEELQRVLIEPLPEAD